MKNYRVTVNGVAYDVVVEELAGGVAPAAAPAPVAAAPAPAPAAGAGTPVPSPLAGKVVSLDVTPGTAVKEGDQIMTLEAMKMNTVIYAPANGTVTSFAVAAGDTVAENQTLAYLG
jgi:biotin carboxyl carrier protein